MVKELLAAARSLRAVNLTVGRIGRAGWRLAVQDQARHQTASESPRRARFGPIVTLETLQKYQARNRKIAEQAGTLEAEMARARALAERGVSCLVCGDSRFVGIRLSEGQPAVPVPCDCMPLWERAQFAGIPPRYRDSTVARFRHAPGKNIARAFAETWDGSESVVFWGDVGRGKTHLGCGLLLKNLAKGMPAKFVSVADLMDELKARFDRGDAEKEQSQAYFDRIANQPVLMLDDLGKEQPTPWTRERVSTLLDRRYRTQAPTIITTNLNHEEIADRYGSHLADRLYDWTFVEVGGVSVRKEGIPA